MESTPLTCEIIHVKNMVCNCCIRIIKEDFQKEGIIVNEIRLGVINIAYNSSIMTNDTIRNILFQAGFELISDKEEILVEQIKLAVIERIHYSNNISSIINKSDYLVEKLGYSYQHLSKLFSKYESITLEKFIILHKIEKIKELLDGKEYTLSEISYIMDYSSVQHLSMQFKSVTGLTVSEYKKSDKKSKKPLDRISFEKNNISDFVCG